MPTEDKEIGLGLDLGEGTFENTGVSEDGKLVLLDLEGNLPSESEESKIYRQSIEQGDRRELINLNSDAISIDLYNIINGATSGAKFLAQDSNGKFIEFVFSKNIKINSFTITQSSNTSQGQWVFQVYNKNNQWIDLKQFSYVGTTIVESFINDVPSDKYRLLGVSGRLISTPFQREIDFTTLPVTDSELQTQGTWTSEVIDLQYKFKEFKKISANSIIPESANVSYEVRFSDDNLAWSPFVATSPDGSFLQPAKRYVQVKINLFAGYTKLDDIVDLTSEQVVKDKVEKPYYFETSSTGMKITTDPEIPMKLDNEYTGEGHVYIAELEKDEFITETITKLDIT